MDHLVFTGDRNTESNDFKGAFKPESERYERYYTARGDKVTVHRIDLSLRESKRLKAVQDIIAASRFDYLVFFCHGWRTGIQLGLQSDSTDDLLALGATAKLIAASSSDALRVVLYCCSTGSSKSDPDTGDGGFADRLRDALCVAGRTRVSVFSHTDAGRTAMNSRIRIFEGKGSPTGGVGGVDLTQRGTPQSAVLYKKLHDSDDPFRWQIPYLSIDEIRARLV